jgi:hypothetical protein
MTWIKKDDREEAGKKQKEAKKQESPFGEI